MRLESLGSPLPLGTRRARNRVLFGPHETNLDRGRSISERHVAYYRRRADGGAGVVVVEEASVDPSDWPYERCPLALECGEGWAAVANALHEAGALALAALGHAGGQRTSANGQLPWWAPSPVPEVPGREVAKAMEEQDIAAVVRGFASATRLAVSPGLDGVEVNAGQHSAAAAISSGSRASARRPPAADNENPRTGRASTSRSAQGPLRARWPPRRWQPATRRRRAWAGTAAGSSRASCSRTAGSCVVRRRSCSASARRPLSEARLRARRAALHGRESCPEAGRGDDRSRRAAPRGSSCARRLRGIEDVLMSLDVLPEISFEDQMSTVDFRVAAEPHIVVDNEVCRHCSTRECVHACPADLFVPREDGRVLFKRPYRPRARALDPPDPELPARERSLKLSGALATRGGPHVVRDEPAEAAEQLLGALRTWGYIE